MQHAKHAENGESCKAIKVEQNAEHACKAKPTEHARVAMSYIKISRSQNGKPEYEYVATGVKGYWDPKGDLQGT